LTIGFRLIRIYLALRSTSVKNVHVVNDIVGDSVTREG